MQLSIGFSNRINAAAAARMVSLAGMTSWPSHKVLIFSTHCFKLGPRKFLLVVVLRFEGDDGGIPRILGAVVVVVVSSTTPSRTQHHSLGQVGRCWRRTEREVLPKVATSSSSSFYLQCRNRCCQKEVTRPDVQLQRKIRRPTRR